MQSSKIRLVVTITVLLIGGFLATTLVSYFVAHKSLSEQVAENTLPLTSDNVYSEIQRDLLRPIFISKLMAQDTFVRDWVLAGELEPEKIIRYLETIQKRFDTVTSYFVSEKTRRYYHPTGVLKTVSKDDPADAWFFRVRNLGEEYEINVDRDTADRSKLTVFINYRVYGFAGEFIGVIGVGLAVEAVKELVDAYEKRYGRQVYFIDREGTVTLHGDAFTGATNIRNREGMGSIATVLLTSPGGAFSYEHEGRARFVNSRYVPEFNWLLIVEQNGTYGDEKLVKTFIINLFVAVVITIVVILAANLTVGGYQRKLEEMASLDKLTGVLNRQVFDGILNQSMKLAERKEHSLSLVIFDLDHFKEVNDNYGHLAGDEVLRSVADKVGDILRESDVICRWGGEEFFLLFPECNAEQAREIAEKMRKQIETHFFNFAGKSIQITASFGVAEYAPGESEADLINRADQALLKAKSSGRNRVEFKGLRLV